jgi:hypothetical protein
MFFLHFFGMGGCLFLNPRSHFVGGLLAIISTSLSWSASTRVAAWWDFSLLFLLGFFVELQQLGFYSCARHHFLVEVLQPWSLMEPEV